MKNDADKKFSVKRRIGSFSHAGRGVCIHFKETHNSWIEGLIFLCVVYLGWYSNITETEWLFIILASSMVFVSEAFNTAIEMHMDLTSPEFNPCAKDTKDIAAGAVLISAIAALIVGLIIFVPKIF